MHFQASDNEMVNFATEKIKNLSAVEERQLKVIKLEYELLKYEGATLPQMTDENWLILLEQTETIDER